LVEEEDESKAETAMGMGRRRRRREDRRLTVGWDTGWIDVLPGC
jgi:hypothetical protein